MKTFLKLFTYLSKDALKDFSFSFWVLLYPIILVSIYFVSFSGIMNQDMGTVRVAMKTDNPYHYVFEQAGDYFEIIDVDSQEAGKELVTDDKADGFVDNNLDVFVSKSSGVPQSVLKNVVTQIKQVQSLRQGAATIDFNKSWVTQETTDVSQGTMLFYTAIASFTMYSLFTGVVCAAYLNGNLSPIGRRIMGSPFSKGKLIINCFMIGLLLNIASNAILLVYMTQVLKINLFADWAGSLLLILLGNVFGIATGLLIGTNQKLTIQGRIMFSLIINLVLSALAGMMGTAIRGFANTFMPGFNQFNPVALMVTGFYQLNRLVGSADLSRIYLLLGVYTLALLGCALWRLRRTRYDSL